MTDRDTAAAALAIALLDGPWQADQLAHRTRQTFGLTRSRPWVRQLVDEVLAAYGEPPLDRPRELAAVLAASKGWRLAWSAPRRRNRVTPRVVDVATSPTRLVRRPWPVTELPDLGALARLLDLDQGELAWFADLHGRERGCPPPLRHYTWHELPRRGGGRLVAAPKPRLKEIQRRLLRHVLEPIPVHDAAHGAVTGRSVRSALEPHAGHTVVLRVDLTAFFASIPAGRVWGLLRLAGLPEPVAHTATGLLTTVAPRAVSTDPRLRTPHLPQGAPSSPRLANLVAYSLDRRLAGLAARYGAGYTRYVDDLTFSGGRSLRTARSRFLDAVEEIVRDEGFAVNARKTVVLGDAGRQQLLGAVVNAHPALPRRERDRLRAVLHNCAVHGWASQCGGRDRDEFRAHLLGRVAWAGALHPAHGLRLRAIADRIDWD